MKAILNVAFLAYLLLTLAFPRVAWPATPAPTPIPLSVLPLSYDSFCEGKHQGHVARRLYVAGVGTYVVCGRNPARAWLFTKVGVPMESTPVPGLPPA